VNRLDALIKKSIREHRAQKATDKWNNINEKNPYNYYRVAQHILKPKVKCTQYPIKDAQGNTLHDDKDIAQAFETLYTDIYQPPNPPIVNDETRALELTVNNTASTIKNLTADPNADNKSEINDPVTIEDITIALKKTKSTAPGEDKIYYQHLNELPQAAIKFLSQIYAACLKINYFPAPWKTGITILIPKPNKDPSKTENYRPITLLNTLGKIFERIINNRLKSFCETNNLFPPSQAGFRTCQSTQDQLIRLTEDAQRGIIKRQLTIATFFDINKAFDKIWHEALIYKLLHIHKLSISTVLLLTNFLTNRKIKIKINNSYSNEIPLHAGTPQGAILSPTIFNLWVADIPQPSPGSNLSQFADDIATWSTNKSPTSALKDAQEYNNQIANWCNKWRILLAPNKTQFIIFSRKTTPLTARYTQTINGTVIKAQSTATFLGITFDEQLKLHAHHQKTITQLKQRTALFNKITGSNRKPNLNSNLCTQILKSMIIPLIYYAPTIQCIKKRTYFELQDKIILAAARRAIHAPSTISRHYVMALLNIKPSLERTLELGKQYITHINRSTTIKEFIIANPITGTQLSKIKSFPTPLALLVNPYGEPHSNTQPPPNYEQNPAPRPTPHKQK
jgi:hypothetical protein